jgi:hypothetical protein
MEISAQMGIGLKLMALLVLLSGMAVLFSIAEYQTHVHQKEFNLLKILGLDLVALINCRL